MNGFLDSSWPMIFAVLLAAFIITKAIREKP